MPGRPGIPRASATPRGRGCRTEALPIPGRDTHAAAGRFRPRHNGEACSLRANRKLFAYQGGYAFTENFDGMQHLGMGKRRDPHLEGDARDAPKRFVDVQNLLSDGFRVTNNQGSLRAARGIELRPCGWRPTPFFADLGEGMRIAGEKVVCRLLRRVSQKPNAVQPHAQLLRLEAGAAARLAVELDVRTKVMGLAANNTPH